MNDQSNFQMLFRAESYTVSVGGAGCLRGRENYLESQGVSLKRLRDLPFKHIRYGVPIFHGSKPFWFKAQKWFLFCDVACSGLVWSSRA